MAGKNEDRPGPSAADATTGTKHTCHASHAGQAGRASHAARGRGARWFAMLLALSAVGAASPSEPHARTFWPAVAPRLEALATTIEAPAEDPAAIAATPDEGPADETRRPFPFLPGEDATGSVSVGDTSHGHLVNGVRLDESDALAILPRQKKRNLRHGTAQLVAALEHASRVLYRETGTKLWVGNLGREHGGDIPWSVSHNSGRDADIAFAYQNAAGRPVDPPDLVPLNEEGLARGHRLRFDAARTWTIIRALLTTPDAEVQYLFMSSSLRRQVLEHATATGVSPALIQRAAEVVRQPGGAAPHDDHLHLRVFCRPRDMTGGCTHSGRPHPRAAALEATRDAAATRAASLLSTPQAATRAAAIERLVLLRATGRAPAIASRLDDDAAVVRAASARALGVLRARRHGPDLVARFDDEPSLEVQRAILGAVGALGGKGAGRFLAAAVGQPRPMPGDAWLPMVASTMGARAPDPVLRLLPSLVPGALLASRNLSAAGDTHQRALQRAALEAMVRAERLEPVAAAIEMLTDPDPELRQRAARALRHTTNLTYHVDWVAADRAALARGVARWRAALARSPTASRRDWLVTGFRGAGFDVPALRQRHAWALVRAVAGPEHLSFNAQRTLMRLFDHTPPSLDWDRGDACRYWRRWLGGRRQRYRLERPPAAVASACHRPSP
ncbi:MAG: penicillin-insensitive murein endopeptidase [Myxococcota bacterium]